MRIHSDTLRRIDFMGAVNDAGLCHVWIEDYSEHGSRKRARGFEVRLAASEGRDRNGKARRPRMNAPYGGEDGKYQKAATYDEHGYWIAELYKIDPGAVVGPYDDETDFHRKTDGKYADDLSKIL